MTSDTFEKYLAKNEGKTYRNSSKSSSTRNLAQAFHYRFHLSVAAEDDGDDLPDEVDDWVTDEFRQKQLKNSANWYVSAFSSALSSSANKQPQSEQIEASINQKTNKPTLNTLLGITGITQQEVTKLFEVEIYPPEDEEGSEEKDEQILRPKLERRTIRKNKHQQKPQAAKKLPVRSKTQKDAILF